MEEIEVQARRIGGSIGILLPHDVVQKEGIKSSQTVRILIKRQHTIDDFFGVTHWKRSTKDAMKDIKEGWK